jgi:ABC-type glycerol-3-phosphate transport system substrate-binding protein
MLILWQKAAVGAVGIVLAACSAGASPTPAPTAAGSPASSGTPAVVPVTITFEHQFGDAESAKFDQLVKQYAAANPGITIKTIRDNDASYYDKLVTAFMADSAPDIVRVEPPRAAQFIAAGYAAPLNGVISAADQAQFFPGTITPLQKDGKLYGVPQDVATLVLYYRTDMFKAAGIAAPPTTWDELLADAQQLTKAPSQYGLGLFGGWGGFEFYPWLWQAGGEMLDPSNKTVTFNDAGGVKALQFWADLQNKYKVMPPGAATLTEDDYKGPFVNGKLAMFTSGPWIAGWLKGAGIGGKWAAAPLPKDVNDASVLGGMDIIVNAKSEHQAEAGKFLTWLLQDSVQTDWASSLGFVPIKQSMYSDPKFSSDPLNAIFLAELKVSRSRPTIAQAGQLDDLLGKAVQAALSGASTPKAALDDAVQKAQQLLK